MPVHSQEFSESPLTLHLAREADTERLGQALAGALAPGLVIHLEGDLGAGKTTLTRALLRALGHAGPVKSPTYALVEVYKLLNLYLYHFDFYRFEHPEEFVDAGLAEYFRDDSVCVVEWPDKAAGVAPGPDLRIGLRHEGAGRRAELVPASQKGALCLTRLDPALISPLRAK